MFMPVKRDLMDIEKMINKYLREVVAAGVTTNNAMGGTTPGIPRDYPPMKQRKKYIYVGSGSRKMWLTNKKNG